MDSAQRRPIYIGFTVDGRPAVIVSTGDNQQAMSVSLADVRDAGTGVFLTDAHGKPQGGIYIGRGGEIVLNSPAPETK